MKMWQDKMMRMGAHGEECKLAPVDTINALRRIMTGNGLWEAGRGHTDAAKSYEDLLKKAKG